MLVLYSCPFLCSVPYFSKQYFYFRLWMRLLSFFFHFSDLCFFAPYYLFSSLHFPFTCLFFLCFLECLRWYFCLYTFCVLFPFLPVTFWFLLPLSLLVPLSLLPFLHLIPSLIYLSLSCSFDLPAFPIFVVSIFPLFFLVLFFVISILVVIIVLFFNPFMLSVHSPIPPDSSSS